LKLRKCTLDDFGLADSYNPTQKFFNVTSTKRDEFKRVLHSLYCLDEDVELQGDWNSAEASMLTFTYEQCNPEVRKTCKSDEEIKKWLKKRYMLFAYNKQVFIDDGFDEAMFKKQTVLEWQRINIFQALVQKYKV